MNSNVDAIDDLCTGKNKFVDETLMFWCDQYSKKPGAFLRPGRIEATASNSAITFLSMADAPLSTLDVHETSLWQKIRQA